MAPGGWGERAIGTTSASEGLPVRGSVTGPRTSGAGAVESSPSQPWLRYGTADRGGSGVCDEHRTRPSPSMTSRWPEARLPTPVNDRAHPSGALKTGASCGATDAARVNVVDTESAMSLAARPAWNRASVLALASAFENVRADNSPTTATNTSETTTARTTT